MDRRDAVVHERRVGENAQPGRGGRKKVQRNERRRILVREVPGLMSHGARRLDGVGSRNRSRVGWVGLAHPELTAVKAPQLAACRSGDTPALSSLCQPSQPVG